MPSNDYTILEQTALSVLRCQYRPGLGSLMLQELSATGLLDMTLDAGHLAALLQLLPSALFQAELARRCVVHGAPYATDQPWQTPTFPDEHLIAHGGGDGMPGMLTLDLDEPETPPAPHGSDLHRATIGARMACTDLRCAYCYPVAPAQGEGPIDAAAP